MAAPQQCKRVDWCGLCGKFSAYSCCVSWPETVRPSSAACSARLRAPTLTARPLPMIARFRAAKALEGALAEIKMDQFPRCPTRAVCGAYIALQVCSRWIAPRIAWQHAWQRC